MSDRDTGALARRVGIVTGAAHGPGSPLPKPSSSTARASCSPTWTTGRSCSPPDASVAQPHPCDVVAEDQVSGLVTACVARFGRLDVLAMTAAIWHNDHADEPVIGSLIGYEHGRPLGIGRLGRSSP
jgi:hypothetical protein